MQTDIQINRQTDRLACIITENRHTYTHIDIQTDSPRHGQTDIWAGRQTDRQKYI